MPIVVVHGVGTRSGRAYTRRVAARTALVRRFLCRPLGLEPEAVTVLNPYWGDVAARFRWNHLSLPDADDEAFGTEPVAPTEVLLAESTLGSLPASPAHMLLAASGRSLHAATDLLWCAAADVEWATEAELDTLAATVVRILGSEATTVPDDLQDDVALLRHIVGPLATEGGHDEAFGRGDAGTVDLLREGLSRIRTSGTRLVSASALELLRRKLHEMAAVFAGDAVTYLRQREQFGAAAPISRTVAEALVEAARARSAADPRVVVIAHSMGGNIVFDLLNHLRPELCCDVLVTVGSQVGLFAELDLFEGVHAPADPLRDRAPVPASIGHWLNVYDSCDVLAFAAGRIFEGVQDRAFSTGVGLIKSHSSYFIRPSFFDRLAAFLNEVG